MSGGGHIRTRTDRVSAFEIRPKVWAQALGQLRRRDVLLRLGIAGCAAILTWLVTVPWDPPFPYRTGDIPDRDIVARVTFEDPQEADQAATQQARIAARRQAHCVYQHDPSGLIQLEARLRNLLVGVAGAATLETLDPEVWKAFELPTEDGSLPTREQQDEHFAEFRSALAGEGTMARVQDAIHHALSRFEQIGLLEELPPEQATANQQEIIVFPAGSPDQQRVVPLADVLIGVQAGDGSGVLDRLRIDPATAPIADRLFNWLRNSFNSTLTLDAGRTQDQREAAAAAVPPVPTSYGVGQHLVRAGEQLGPKEIRLLQYEQQAALADPSISFDRLYRCASMAGLILAMFLVCGQYVAARQKRLLANVQFLTIVLGMMVVTVGLGNVLSADAWRAEIIPLLLFGLTICIAFGRELAFLFSFVAITLVVLSVGHDLGEFFVLLGVVSAALISLNRIRSRIKLIKVCAGAAIVAFALTIGLGAFSGRELNAALFSDASLISLWTLVTGFLITGLLPFVESLFGVLTDLSLLELGDVAHPLLQELVRNAPGTYNHSINVASLAEAAAESIGARGLLVRVGAYFHDIGKMLKPEYFIENQGQGNNRHESLVPAMSTLIIIAHIKDGADLARKYHLPQPIIDFIEQHHGTTLVEYFFHRATAQQEANPDGSRVAESAFRYPGPKPQTREAAVMMLADVVEGASRTLVDPTPARIQGLVRDLCKKRLLDGQFDECDLNLQELHLIEESLAKSLIAVYHGRIKYPDQRTA